MSSPDLCLSPPLKMNGVHLEYIIARILSFVKRFTTKRAENPPFLHKNYRQALPQRIKLRPRVSRFRRLYTGQEVLLPQKPLSVTAALTQLYRARRIRSPARNEQLHIASLLRGNVVAFDGYRVRLGWSVTVFGR